MQPEEAAVLALLRARLKQTVDELAHHSPTGSARGIHRQAHVGS